MVLSPEYVPLVLKAEGLQSQGRRYRRCSVTQELLSTHCYISRPTAFCGGLASSRGHYRKVLELWFAMSGRGLRHLH